MDEVPLLHQKIQEVAAAFGRLFLFTGVVGESFFQKGPASGTAGDAFLEHLTTLSLLRGLSIYGSAWLTKFVTGRGALPAPRGRACNFQCGNRAIRGDTWGCVPWHMPCFQRRG